MVVIRKFAVLLSLFQIKLVWCGERRVWVTVIVGYITGKLYATL